METSGLKLPGFLMGELIIPSRTILTQPLKGNSNSWYILQSHFDIAEMSVHETLWNE